MAYRVTRRGFLGVAGGAMAGGTLGSGVPAAAAAAVRPRAAAAGGAEPDINQALSWWPPTRNVNTPIGWKDHLFRFTSFYNGSLVAAPMPPLNQTPGTYKYREEGFQLDFGCWDGWFDQDVYPDLYPDLYPGHFYVYREDMGFYGVGQQHWATSRTPVLCTEYRTHKGVTIRQSVFAHVKGGGAVSTGVEPMYAWIRLEVTDILPIAMDDGGPVGFAIRVGRNYYTLELPYKFQDGITLTGYPERSPFLADVTGQNVSVGGRNGVRISQPDEARPADLGWPNNTRPGGVRMEILTDAATPPNWTQPKSRIYNLRTYLDKKVGSKVDILLAMLPQPAAEFDRELALGYDGALAECERFWTPKPATAATIRTPELYVNELIDRNTQFSEVIAEKIPGTNQYSFLTGSHGYDVLWTTPSSFTSHMFLDPLGYHEVVARHTEIYLGTQGTLKPPGSAYTIHPGYYGSPRSVQAIDWLSDHGAVMHLVATHALLTGDAAYIAKWTDSLVKACAFVKDVCALTGHRGIPGLPPPGVATDEGTEVVSVWTVGWFYKGLTSAVKLLKKLNHPRAAEFQQEADRFKSVFLQAFTSYNATQPTWLHPDGKRYPVYSENMQDVSAHPFGEIPRLDTGPMFLVYAGLMAGSDARMQKFADYFRYGPNVAHWGNGSRKNPLDRPILEREISSCEPIYSWNLWISWAIGDRARFLEGMYSLLAGGHSVQTYTPFEHRHGMSSCQGTNGSAFWMMRHAVIDDEIVDGELHLLRICPQPWIAAEQTVFQNVPTYYGPVDLKFSRASDGALELTFAARWREKPRSVVLHFPVEAGITTARVNGSPVTRGPNNTAIIGP